MKLLICKNTLSNTLIEQSLLNESDNIKYELVDSPPVIEERDGYIGVYVLNADGTLGIEYRVKPKTTDEKIAEQESIIADLMMEIALLKGGK